MATLFNIFYKHTKSQTKLKIINNKNKKQLAVLFDPDKVDEKSVQSIAEKSQKNGVDFFLVGGSIISNYLDNTIKNIKKVSDLPVYIFPGSLMQISEYADGILFISLISGRNPDFLIGNHVVVAPFLKKSKLDIIPTGYMLIEGGNTTSVEYMSNTKPIPNNKTDIAVATAMAGEFSGKKMIYADAGSGAGKPVSKKMISEIKKNINIPLIVGGGINTDEKLKNAYSAGADIVVIGTVIEKNKNMIENFCKIKIEFNV